MSALEWRERVRLHQSAKRAARYERGLCVMCGLVPPKTDHKSCEPCLETARAERKARRAEARNQ